MFITYYNELINMHGRLIGYYFNIKNIDVQLISYLQD